MLDSFGEMLDPEYSKIVDTKNSKAKTPLNCSRNINPMPIDRTFFAGFVTERKKNVN